MRYQLGRWMFTLISGVVTLPVLQGQVCDLRIEGKVLSAGDQEPLGFANIYIMELQDGTLADADGSFSIDSLCAGVYTLVCSHVGCDHQEHQVVLTEDLLHFFVLEENTVQLEQITVEAAGLRDLGAQPTVALEGAELEAGKGLNLGTALEEIPGVRTLKTGATIAKPVIQGLHSNRVLILNNGVRQEGQQWGNEHAPEVDPFLAEKITIIRGAAGVRYGADAIGGVILVEPKALPEQPGLGGELILQGLSNGRTGVVSGILEGKLPGKLPLSGRLQGTLKRGGNLRTPDYFLDNTGVEEANFSWALRLDQEKWSTEVFYSRFFNVIGILSDAHIGNLTDLQNAINRGRPLSDGAFSYELGRPQQRIVHELVKSKSFLQTGENSSLSLQLTRQFNRRQEFDAHRPFGDLPEGYDEPDIEFEITSYTADLAWEHQLLPNTEGTIGLSWLGQRNTTDRGALIPNYEASTASIYWIEKWRNYPFPLAIEGGLRYDYRTMSIGRQGTENIDDELDFSNISGTLGFIYQLPGNNKLRLNLSSAWRAPNVNELYSEGVHHGSASYESGNRELQVERAYNTSLSIELDPGKKFTGSATAYYNLIQDFIYLQPQERPVLTIRGAFPAFAYEQANARLAGIDWQWQYRFHPRWQTINKGSILRARNRSEDEDLIFMPADRFEQEVRYVFASDPDLPDRGFVGLSVQYTRRQNRVPEGIDFAPPPDGYTLLNIDAGTTLNWGKQPIEVGLSVNNVLHTAYRDYLNRFRYYADEPGRNIILRVQIPFTIY